MPPLNIGLELGVCCHMKMGRISVSAIQARDMPLLQGSVLFATVLVIAGNLVADILYSVLDPRIRYQMKGEER